MTYKLDPQTEIGQVKLKVSRLDDSIAFYEEVVGLRVLERTAVTAALTADDVKPLVLLEELPDAVKLPRRSAAGLYHFALLLPDRRSLGLALRNLIRSGIHIGSSDHLVSEALYIADPDNNGIEIYADRPRSSWQYDAAGHVLMATNPLDRDGLLVEAEEAPWDGLPKGTKLGHIHLHVSGLAESQSFYSGVLGFDVVSRYADNALFISAGGYHHHIGLNVWAGAGAPLAPAHAAGLAYFTVAFAGAEPLENTLAQLRNAGVPVHQEAEAWIVHDPSGIELRLVTQPTGSEAG
ncbi:VOC family protein [Paenibacillus sp. TAB 01]|uniref:VOC family protein n=1 Tax=Paenibacillus sp. TAB 01 TaxID=3368988 RepID=UPI003751455C